MKILLEASELESQFIRLMNNYEKYYWSTAWASINSQPYKELLMNVSRIKKMIVGVHFYQTHPNFIEEFLNNPSVKFILQPEGTFHPKLYLFENNQKSWELIIGSANFTQSAFSSNLEASLLISNLDSDAQKIYKKVSWFINDVWKKADQLNENDLDKYKVVWNNHRSKVNSLSGNYSGKNNSKPIFKSSLLNKKWNEFISEIKNESIEHLENRLRVLEIAAQLFEKVKHFSQLTEDERKFIAGIPNNLLIEGAEHWAYFGSMKGAGHFKKKIIENDKNISKALDQVPISGQITKRHYNNFIHYYSKSLSGNYIATSSRLLSMKRPDIFVCLDNKNKSKLCKDFGIKQSEFNYIRYWEDIIERIYDSDWWLNPNPKNELERRVSSVRSALLDSIYYEY